MKSLILGLLVFGFVASADASCGSLVEYRSVLAREMFYLRNKIATETNSDKIELYWTQYDRLQERWFSVTETIEKDCVSNND